MKNSRIVALVAAVFVSIVAVEAQVPVDNVLRDFEPMGDYVLVINGQQAPKATIYQSQRAASFLIRAPQLAEPILVSPRTGSVESVSIMSLAQQPSGIVDILADAQTTPRGSFRLDGEEVIFSLDGKELRLRPNPPLTGFHDRQDLLEHNPAYGFKASGYSPDPATVKALKGTGKDVKVRVFFGSWCPTCSRYVPLVLKVDEALEGAVDFSYYGLPKSNFQNDPEAKKANVTGVPTIIVYVGGKEVGRLGSQDWGTPEQAIQNLIGQG